MTLLKVQQVTNTGIYLPGFPRLLLGLFLDADHRDVAHPENIRNIPACVPIHNTGWREEDMGHEISRSCELACMDRFTCEGGGNGPEG